jgi:hypothetical protein
MIQLRDYQIEKSQQAAVILKAYGLVYLAFEPRTGKTLTSMETARYSGAKNVLFLTKKKAIKSIEGDYQKGEYELNFKITITNYENLHKVDTTGIDFFILDEAHNLAQYPKPSLRTKRLRMLIGKKPVVYLSGTPSPEGFSGLYHQLWVSRNSPWDKHQNFYQWCHAGYVNVYQVKRGLYMINNYDRADAERIKKDLMPITITYSQEQAGFKCAIEEHFLEVDDPGVAQLMRRIFKYRILTFEEGAAPADTPSSLMGKLHQLAGGSIICENGTATVSEEKARFIKEHFAGKRIAIFYKFIGEKKILDKHFPWATTSPEAFQAGESNTFLSQVCSGREGLALSTADAIVFYAIDFAAVSFFQARARIQDLKRETPAQIYWVFFKGSIENKVYKAVSNKLDFTMSYYVRSGLI